MERDRKEPLLAAGAADDAADVEERGRAQPPVDEDADPARLLDHVEVVRLRARRTDEDRAVEALRDLAKAKLPTLVAAARAVRDDDRESARGARGEKGLHR